METRLQVGGVYSLDKNIVRELTNSGKQVFVMVTGEDTSSREYNFIAYSLTSEREGDLRFTHASYEPSETFGVNYIIKPLRIQEALRPLSKTEFDLFARAYGAEYTLKFHDGEGIGKLRVSERNLIESRVPHLTLKRGTKRKVA